MFDSCVKVFCSALNIRSRQNFEDNYSGRIRVKNLYSDIKELALI